MRKICGQIKFALTKYNTGDPNAPINSRRSQSTLLNTYLIAIKKKATQPDVYDTQGVT